MKINSKFKFFLYLSVLFLIFPKPAHAYLDPGAGSYILQIIAAALFTGLFFFKNWWKKAKGFFKKIMSLISKKDKQSNDKNSKKE